MILATFVPFLRRNLSFGPADHFGKLVAHHDLLKACLRHNVVSSAVIFAPSTLPRFAARERALQEAALRENAEESGDHRIAVAPLEALPQMVSTGEMQFVSGGAETTRVAQLRASLPGSFLPITTLVHAVAGWPDLLPAYLALVATAEPYDTVVVTSAAAETAVKQFLEMAAGLLGADGVSARHAQAGAGAAFEPAGLGTRSPALRDRASETGVTWPEVVRIPLAAEDNLFEPLPKDYCRKLLGLKSADFVVLSVGRLSEEYKADLEPLLVAFKRLTEAITGTRAGAGPNAGGRDARGPRAGEDARGPGGRDPGKPGQAARAPGAVLLLAGQDAEGLYAPAVRACAQSLGVQDRVRIIENFPLALKRVLYGAADVFVSPADNIQESFGIAVTEAMASGLPVVASDWSGYRDIVVHRETGFLVPTYWDEAAAAAASVLAPVDLPLGTSYQLARHTVIDAELLARYLLLTYTKPEMRAQMGKCGAARARANYSWPVVMRQYEEMWKQARSRNRSLPRAAKDAARFGRGSAGDAGGFGRGSEADSGGGSAGIAADNATPRVPWALNLNTVFGHYATAKLDPAMRVCSTARGRDLLSAGAKNGASGLADAARKRAVQILECCRKRPVAIGDLIRESLDPSWKEIVSVRKRQAHPQGLLHKERSEIWQVVVYLLKKGYLGIQAEPSASV